MTYRTPDRTQETVTGTSTLALSGRTSLGFRNLADAGIADGDYFPGVVTHRTLDQWKSGVWQRSGGNLVLVRLHDSSTGGDFTFTDGTKDLLVTSLGRQSSPRVVTSADSPYTVLPGDDLQVDTTGGEVTLNLWATLIDGEPGVRITDAQSYWATNNCIVDAGSEFIARPGLSDIDRLICDTPAMIEVYAADSKFRVR